MQERNGIEKIRILDEAHSVFMYRKSDSLGFLHAFLPDTAGHSYKVKSSEARAIQSHIGDRLNERDEQALLKHWRPTTGPQRGYIIVFIGLFFAYIVVDAINVSLSHSKRTLKSLQAS
jgi:hypothetical protein